jgi:DNA (cytosine-5)-methyltransferase 1
MVFRLGELFCGPGGLALGAKRAVVFNNGEEYRIEHAWANDIDEDSCITYKNNICPNQPESVICKDVRNLKLSELTPIDCFAYGFPCNDFSVVGEQKGFYGEYGPLYLYGVKIINHFKPKFFLAENVSGLTTANGGKAFNKILSDLESSGDGYNLTVHLYKAEQYGVPQTRHRIIIVGISKKEGFYFKVPKPTHINKYVSAREAIENPPITANAFNNEITKQSKLVEERLKYIKPGENAWTANLPNYLKLNVKKARLSHIYRRLDPDKPSYTITGSGGGGTHCYHWDKPRALTNRERARLQTFPDNYIFYGSKESVRKQIGMAVPPLLAEIIFTHILKCFAGINYEYINANIADEINLFSNIAGL